jgi:hypothetical protein
MSNTPGAIMFTLIFRLTRSRATGNVMPTLPPVDVEYAA